MENVLKVDRMLTNWVRLNVGQNRNKYIALAPYYCGLFPYEMYVLPGMFFAIFGMFFYESYIPMQFHLLPHWFAFSMATYIKHNVHRVRPGCVGEKGLDMLMDPKHCEGSTRMQSFPSGHTSIAVALATSLSLYLRDPSYAPHEKHVLGVSFASGIIQQVTVVLAYFVAFMISIHRVGYGYHNVSDVIVGAIMGFMIAYTTHFMCNRMRGVNPSTNTAAAAPSSSKVNHDHKKVWSAIRLTGMALSTIALAHFFVYKFHKLSALQH